MSNTKHIVRGILQRTGLDIHRLDKSSVHYKQLFKKYKEFTMIDEHTFVNNLELIERYSNVKGDYVECGVWRGGMSAAISEVIGQQRAIHLFDSFEGLPPAKEIDGKEALAWQKDVGSPKYFDNCAAEDVFVTEAMALAGTDKYHIHKGWFDETVPQFRNHIIGVLRLDGDWYDSIMICLQHLFPQVVEGGIIILDDYYTWDGCAKAVHDYLSKVQSPSRVWQWNNHVPYIIKKND